MLFQDVHPCGELSGAAATSAGRLGGSNELAVLAAPVRPTLQFDMFVDLFFMVSLDFLSFCP